MVRGETLLKVHATVDVLVEPMQRKFKKKKGRTVRRARRQEMVILTPRFKDINLSTLSPPEGSCGR